MKDWKLVANSSLQTVTAQIRKAWNYPIPIKNWFEEIKAETIKIMTKDKE